MLSFDDVTCIWYHRFAMKNVSVNSTFLYERSYLYIKGPQLVIVKSQHCHVFKKLTVVYQIIDSKVNDHLVFSEKIQIKMLKTFLYQFFTIISLDKAISIYYGNTYWSNQASTPLLSVLISGYFISASGKKHEKHPPACDHMCLKPASYMLLQVASSKKFQWYVHCSDAIMMESQITGVSTVCSTVGSCADQIKHQTLCHWQLCGEFGGDRWIPNTKGQ